MRIQLRRGTAAAWTTANPVLAEGEIGVELDTLQAKIGDGTDHWNDLDYAFATGAEGPAGPTGPAGTPGSLWRVGTLAPDIAAPGIDGDLWFTRSNGNVYQRTSGAYALIGNIRGPAGADGTGGGGGGSDIDGGGVVG